MDIRNIFVSTVLAATLSVGAILLARPQAPVVHVDIPDQAVSVTPSYAGFSGPDISSPYFSVGGQATYYTPISCNTSTSTAFGVANPWSATSTAKLVRFSGVGNATTTTLKIGTSTAAVGAASTVYGIMANATIATSTPFFVASGIRNGPNNSFTDSGANTVQEIVVSPSQSIVGYASTTALGAGAAGFSGGFSSCSGMIRWERGF